MKDCVCGNQSVYFCKSHQTAVCKEHRAMHEEGEQGDHIYEKLGPKLTIQDIATMPIKKAMRLLEEGYNLFLEGHTSYLSSIAITSDSTHIVSSGFDGTVRIWNFKDKTQEAVLKGNTSLVSAVAITSDNKYIVSAGDRTVRIWSLQNKTQEAVLQGHSSMVYSVAITRDSKYIVSGGETAL